MFIKSYALFFIFIFIFSTHATSCMLKKPLMSNASTQTGDHKNLSPENLNQIFYNQLAYTPAETTLAKRLYISAENDQAIKIQQLLEKSEHEKKYWKALAITLTLKSSVTFACAAFSALYYYMYHTV